MRSDLRKIREISNISRGVHQTTHFSTGFIGDPRGQSKAFAKSGLFFSVTSTLKEIN